MELRWILSEMTSIICFILLTGAVSDLNISDIYVDAPKIISIRAIVEGSELMVNAGKNPTYIEVTETPKQVTDKIRSCVPTNQGVVR